MIDEFWEGFLSGALAIGFIMFLVLVATATSCEDGWRRDAIKHNAAIYHPQTGEFTWNDELTTQGVTR